jgi:TrmH family RNA methyltransferase
MDIDVVKSYVTYNVLKYISELDNPSKMIGICNKIDKKDIGNKILILDEIQDPGNLGTIIRSSVAFNVDTIIIGKNSVDIYNSKVLRATQGMLFNINIIEENLLDMIPKLKKDGYKVYGTKVNGGKSLKNVERCEKFAIIMGNEGNGVSLPVLDLCSDYIYIDMNSNCESLNVGVATSIILYELDK